MEKLYALMLAFVLMGCGKDKKPNYATGSIYETGSNGVGTTGFIRGINYFKDTRTGLCFAERGEGSNYTFTCVPCGNVEHLIRK
jgi:hypothetical protein